MDRQKESELFEHLSRYPRFRDWLEWQMAQTVEILLVNNDVEMLRKAQGRAAFIKSTLDKLTEPKST